MSAVDAINNLSGRVASLERRLAPVNAPIVVDIDGSLMTVEYPDGVTITYKVVESDEEVESDGP